MNVKSFAGVFALALSFSTIGYAQTQTPPVSAATTETVQLQQIRNATLKITFGDTTFLVDPMLSKKGTYPGFEGTYRSELRNPLADLPMSIDDILAGMDAVIVTHTHLDHWDEAAQKALPKDIPLFTQNKADETLIRSQGFTNVRVLTDNTQFGGVKLYKTGGQHGTDEMYAIPEVAAALGDAMGVVFKAPGHKTLYLVGDTIWRDEVDQALNDHSPEVVVINAGYATMTDFDGAIIMGKEDVVRAAKVVPKASIVATHMDAINHMAQTRKDVREHAQEHGVADRVEAPEDGETLQF